jgi:hypothetical protein
MCHHIGSMVAATFLAVQFWGVSSALTDRGADLCLTRTSGPERPLRAMEKPCVAELLAGDASGEQRLALHLRGNCQADRGKAMMASRYQIAQAAVEQSWPTCSLIIGS